MNDDLDPNDDSLEEPIDDTIVGDIDDAIDDEVLADLGVDVDEFADEVAVAESAPPIAETVGFFDAGPDAHALDDLHLEGRIGVLERLGPAHFRSKGFSFMGFLQTVYEQVASEVKGETKAAEV